MREVTFHFHLRLREAVAQGHFGIAILNDSAAVLAGWGFDNIDIPAANKKSPCAARPAAAPRSYSLTCSLFNRGNNLTGGQLIEQWYALPSLIVDTRPVSHPQDRWAGVLNIPAEFRVQSR